MTHLGSGAQSSKRHCRSISADFYGPLLRVKYLLVIVDEYTQYPVVENTKFTLANAVISTIDKVLSVFGIPRVVKKVFHLTVINSLVQSI